MKSSTRNQARSYLPLKPIWYEILLSIGCGHGHGYAIRQTVEERTGGAIRLWPTTLYGTLRQLQQAGLVHEVPGVAETDPRGKRQFELTRLGTAVLDAETTRLESLIALARTRSVLAE